MPIANDGHVHVTSREAGTGRSAIDLLADMDSADVGRTAIVTPSTSGWDNTLTFEAVEEYPARFVPVARVDLRAADGLDALRDVLDRGAVGIRIMTFGEELGWLHEERMGQVAALLQERRAVAGFHCEPEQLAAIGGFAAAHPDLDVCIDHLGRPTPGSQDSELHLAFLALADLPNVSAKSPDLNFFSDGGFPWADITPFIGRAIDVFGADRIMWSSDWPLSQEGGPYKLALDGMLAALDGRSEAERTAVLTGTFDRLYGRAR